MNIYLSQLLIVAGIHALAAMSPGPDFLLVSKYSLTRSRLIGIGSAIGVALGIGVHVTYSVLGIGALIASSVALFTAIKITGALYLIYLGISSFKSQGNGSTDSFSETDTVGLDPSLVKKDGFLDAMKAGFLTNVLNPKATLFILAVFTQVVTPTTPRWIQSIYGLEMVVATALWFSLVALCLSAPYLASRMRAVGGYLDKVTGIFLGALGVKILLE